MTSEGIWGMAVMEQKTDIRSDGRLACSPLDAGPAEEARHRRQRAGGNRIRPASAHIPSGGLCVVEECAAPAPESGADLESVRSRPGGTGSGSRGPKAAGRHGAPPTADHLGRNSAQGGRVSEQIAQMAGVSKDTVKDYHAVQT